MHNRGILHRRGRDRPTVRSLRLPGRTRCLAVALVSLLAALGCGDYRQALEAIGVTDPVPEPAVRVALLCDRSEGSTCTAESTRDTLQILLSAIAARPGSTLAVWSLGESFAETSKLIEIVSPVDQAPADRSRKRPAEHWVLKHAELGVEVLTEALKHPLRRSPIAQGIGKIALGQDVDFIIIVSDAREYSDSLGDLECESPLRPAAFLDAMREEEVFRDGALATVEVVFTNMRDGAVADDRCAVSAATSGRLRAAWRTALKGHGSPHVHFYPGRLNSDLIQGHGGIR